jgi:hypothetical protein
MVADAINQLGSPFDAHAVEKRLVRTHTIATAREMVRFHNASDVLHSFSAQLGRYIQRTFRGQIQKTTKVVSENLGGRRCTNQEWRKLVAHVTTQP